MMGLRIRCVCWRPHVLASVNERVEKLDVDLMEIACHLEEKFYPHLLTTIFGRRWLLTHGLKLVLVKCLNSSEYLTALEVAISRSIEKGMQDGLATGIDHGRVGRSLADIVAYNLSVEVDFNSALQELCEVDFRLLANLKSHKDASIEDVMNLLRLESPLADAPSMDSLQHDIEQLKVPIHSLLNVLVEGLEIMNFLLDNFPFHRRVGLSIDLSEEMGSLVMVEHHSKKKERDEGGGIMRARMVSIVTWCGYGEASLEVSWNLKNGKKPTVEPIGRCLWPNSTGLLQRAPTNAYDELNWPSFDTLNLDTRVNIQEDNVLNSKKD
ncbi:hypothetical protein Tco_1359899 [Tanacetum coccineum]